MSRLRINDPLFSFFCCQALSLISEPCIRVHHFFGFGKAQGVSGAVQSFIVALIALVRGGARVTLENIIHHQQGVRLSNRAA